MANILRIYDFELDHKDKKNSVTFYDLAKDHIELQSLIKIDAVNSENLKWAIILDAFRHKFTNDLNSEKLKSARTQKIVKRGIKYDKKATITLKEINIDKSNHLLYSTLNGGKITDKSLLEKVDPKKGLTLEMLNGDRIYDELFFLLHISFRCNKARLFTLTRRNNLNLDTTIKSYFEKNMFKCSNYNNGKWQAYIPKELRAEALERTVINNIAITKSRYLNSTDFDDQFEIEIKLKSKKKGGFGRITSEFVERLKKTHLIIDNDELDDETGVVKFNITDPETRTNKSVVFGDTDNFIPKLALEDRDIINKNQTLDEDKLKSICMKYIEYDTNGTF